MSQDKTFDRCLAKARITGEAHDYRHLQGWHDAAKNAVLALYVQGKASVVQAIAAGARPIDHARAVESGKVQLADLIAAGVDLRKVETSRKQYLGRLGVKVKSDKEVLGVRGKQGVEIQGKDEVVTIAQAIQAHAAKLADAAKPKAMFHVVKGGEKSYTVRPAAKTITRQDVEVAEAMVRANAAEKQRKALAAVKAEGARLNRVTLLSDAEKAELLARLTAKDAPIVVK